MRWIGWGLGVLVALVLGVFGALYLLPADRIARIAEEKFREATGLELRVEGDVRPGLWPEIGVRTGAVTIANPEREGEAPIVEAGGIAVGVAWAGLFSGDIRVTGVELERPVIRIVQGADGRMSWEVAGRDGAPEAIVAPEPAAAAPEPASARSLALDEVRVRDGTVIYTAAGAAPVTLSGIDGTLTLPDFAGAATLTLSAVSNGERVAAEMTISEVAAFLSEGAVPVDLRAEIGGGTVAFAGRAGLSPVAAEGRIDADLPGIGGVTRAASGAPAALPEGLGRDRLRLGGTVTYAGETVSLREAALQADGNAVSGDVDVTLGGVRPRVVARLSAGALDLSGLGGDEPAAAGGGSGGGGGGGATGWSTAPIDVSGLGAVDAEVALSADSIRLPKSQLGRTRIGVDLEDRRLVTTIRELVAYDGAVTGQIVVNGRGGLSASTDLSGSAIAISRLFAELLDFDRLVALGDMDISILTSGNSMDALINGMNGDGRFRFGAGELLGLDLVGMLRNLDPSFVGEGRATIFDEITGRFRIVDGVVIYDNLQMLAPLLSATGTGQIGLGAQTLDLRIVPKLLAGDGEGVSVPVLITGTWDAPRFRLDLASLVDEKAQEELDRAKKRLEEQAKQKVQEKLGVGSEEQLKDTLENELKKGLRSLFD